MLRRLAVPFALLLAIGCSGSSRRPIAGTVTFKGEPIDNGVITFLAIGDPAGPVGGALIRAGKYDVPAAQGLEPGTYGVSISHPGGRAKQTREEIEAGASPRAIERLPAKYNTETKLTIEVPARGPVSGDFTLD